MSEGKSPKLGTLKLTDAEKKAIAEMVETPGFKVWKKKVEPAHELRIAGAALQSNDEKQLFYNKGRSYENGKVRQELETIAQKYHDTNLDDEDEVDNSV